MGVALAGAPRPARSIAAHDLHDCVAAESSRGRLGLSGLAYFAPAPLARPGTTLDLSAMLTATGTGSLDVGPWARVATVRLSSTWPTPSFGGDRLPTSRTVSTKGFDATWELADRGVAGLSFVGEAPPAHFGRASQVSVRLAEELTHYQLVTRTVKYALLVIALTFAAFYLFEIVAGLHIHVVQYGLVGLALVMFYLLLLSQSEHSSFEVSYLVASSAVVVLVTGYTRAVLATTRYALFCGAGLAAVYGLLYVVLSAERFALLTGSWALFLVLALIMYLTRRLDWRRL